MKHSVRFIAFLCVLLAFGAASAQNRAPAAAPATAGQIDINSASRDDLMTLEGIGEVRADAIIRSRPFKLKTELVERRIIPEELYGKIADKVAARAVPVAPPPKPAQPAKR
jgi:DNA uptake protein ComE-like DNA-binding protein